MSLLLALVAVTPPVPTPPPTSGVRLFTPAPPEFTVEELDALLVALLLAA